MKATLLCAALASPAPGRTGATRKRLQRRKARLPRKRPNRTQRGSSPLPSIAGGLASAAANSAQAQGRTRFADKLIEPAIDARTVELHYNNHHKPAATAANRAEEELAKARDSGQFSLV